MKQYIFWTDDEIAKLKELSGRMNFQQMTKHFSGRTAPSLQKKAIKLKIVSEYRYKKHSHDENFLETPNEVNSYYGGFCAMDCHINHRNQFTLSLASKDLEHLENFKNAVKFTGNIRTYQRKKYKQEGLKWVSTLNICSVTQWRIDLKRHFNVEEKKTYRLAPPNITDR